MKKIKFLLLMAMVMTMSLTMSADDDDRVITYDQLPQAAQTFLKANFATTARCPPPLYLPRLPATSSRTIPASQSSRLSVIAASMR